MRLRIRQEKINSTQVSERTEKMTNESLREDKQVNNEQWLNLEQMKIAKWLKKLRFRKKFLGGVSELDVWKKIGELNAMYEAALTAERVRYDALIEHYKIECREKAGEDMSVVEDINEMNHIYYTRPSKERYMEQRESR